MMFQPKVKGLYVLIAGSLLRVSSVRQQQQAMAELARCSRPFAPITRWDGRTWHETGLVLHANPTDKAMVTT